jgi:choline-sulfatase
LWWKRTYYEASAGVPLLVRAPGQQRSRLVGTPVEHVDLFPTFCDWAGIPAPAGVDGETLAPLLGGRPEQRVKHIARSALLGERVVNRFRMARDERWKYVDFPSAPPRLFDLAADPGETRDLIAACPAEAPLDELRRAATAGGSWDELAAAQVAEKALAAPLVKIGRGANQYRLADGRVVDADDHLYKVG